WKIGRHWPKYSISELCSSQDSRTSKVQYTIRSAKVITFSEDKDVVLSTKNAMLKKTRGRILTFLLYLVYFSFLYFRQSTFKVKVEFSIPYFHRKSKV
ncbi:Uncharacterized protein APZ42_000068, partial [Daphnia magna]